MRYLLILLLCFLCAPSQACRNEVTGSDWNKDALIANTPTIVLAQLDSMASDGDGKTTYTFRTIETLKGESQPTFTLLLDSAPGRALNPDFNDHADPGFWQDNQGRLAWAGGACLPRYTFHRHGQYLLFMESLANGASAERILNRSDKWLTHVRKQTTSDAPAHGMLGLILVAVGCVLSVVLAGKVTVTGRLHYLLYPTVPIVVGMLLVAWQVVALMAVFLALFILWIYLFHLKEKAYERNYPVFATNAVHAFTTSDGRDFRLHIAKIRSKFIIGIIYDMEVDGSSLTQQTRWKDEFSDYAAAERALLDRLPGYAPADDIPDLLRRS
jgi:hypothetical protein